MFNDLVLPKNLSSCIDVDAEWINDAGQWVFISTIIIDGKSECQYAFSVICPGDIRRMINSLETDLSVTEINMIAEAISAFIRNKATATYPARPAYESFYGQ